MKSEIDILDDVYMHLKSSELMDNVSGRLRKTKRPDGSDKEDVVISLLTSTPNRQIQEVYLNVNVYVADIKRGEQYEANIIRLRELCKLSECALRPSSGKDYRLTLDEHKVMEVPGKNEHFINNKVKYQFCND